MHRLIMGAEPGDPQVDHENQNGLDCRRHNLRFITHAGNQRNKSTWNRCGIKGIYKTPSGKYGARITINYKVFHIGTFTTPEEAGAAHQAATEKQIKKELTNINKHRIIRKLKQ